MSALAKAMCCTPEPKNSERNRPESVRWLSRAVQRDPHRPFAVLDNLAPDEAGGVGDIDLRRALHLEDRGVEEKPGEHLVVFHRLRDVIDGDAAPRRTGYPAASRSGRNSISHTRDSALFGSVK